MVKLVYVKLLNDYNDIANYKLPKCIKKLLLKIKRILRIITQKEIDGLIIWNLPFFKNEIGLKKEEIKMSILKKVREDNVLVLSKELKTTEIVDILDRYNIKYIKGKLAKKKLIFNVLEYISKLQNKNVKKREISILVSKDTQINIDLIIELANISRLVKIVNNGKNRFKKIEEKLYNEQGIAIQFSNNFKKSLKNADIIINLDFNEEEINKYSISSKAIIVNTEDNMKIKSKSFNGILINFYDIELIDKSIDNKFCDFYLVDIYESLIITNKIIDKNKILIKSVIGNNGRILEKEFKNIS